MNMRERVHRWQWEDFQERTVPRTQLEVEFLSCLLHHPVALKHVVELGLEIQFENPLHDQVYRLLFDEVFSKHSTRFSDVIGNLSRLPDPNEQLQRGKLYKDISMAAHRPPTIELAVEIATLLADGIQPSTENLL